MELGLIPAREIRRGHILAAYAQARRRFYDERKKQEREVRKAIREGRKIYDK